jgi:hypothetical protein
MGNLVPSVNYRASEVIQISHQLSDKVGLFIVGLKQQAKPFDDQRKILAY